MRPRTVKVNGRIVTIKYRATKSMPDNAGLFHSDKALIEVRSEQSSTELRDTTLHEIFHAILHWQGRDYGGKPEEYYVRALATGFIGVLQDNPKLAAWLTGQGETP